MRKLRFLLGSAYVSRGDTGAVPLATSRTSPRADVDFPGLLPPPAHGNVTRRQARTCRRSSICRRTWARAADGHSPRPRSKRLYPSRGSVLGPKFTKENFPHRRRLLRQGGQGCRCRRRSDQARNTRSCGLSSTARTYTRPTTSPRRQAARPIRSGHSTTGALVPLVLGTDGAREAGKRFMSAATRYATNRITSGAASPL